MATGLHDTAALMFEPEARYCFADEPMGLLLKPVDG